MKTKNGWMMAVAVASVLVAAIGAHAAAVSGKDAGRGVSPIGFAITDGAQLPTYRTGVAGLRFALLAGANRRMYGLSIGVLTNGKGSRGGDGDVGGLQIAGVLNDADAAEFGVWQIAGFGNIMRDGGSLVQLAGIYNWTKGPSCGLQLAGVFNRAEGDFTGVQIAGLLNEAEGTFSGLQVAVLNDAESRMEGLQIGVINYAYVLRGIQIGVFNVAGRDMSGLSLGAINMFSDNLALWPLLRVGF